VQRRERLYYILYIDIYIYIYLNIYIYIYGYLCGYEKGTSGFARPRMESISVWSAAQGR